MPWTPAPKPAGPDQPPVAPEKPLASDCCESGCECCVFDVHAEELKEYENKLAVWRTNHPAGIDAAETNAGALEPGAVGSGDTGVDVDSIGDIQPN